MYDLEDELCKPDPSGITDDIDRAKCGGSEGVDRAWLLIDEMLGLFSKQAESKHTVLCWAFARALTEVWNRAYDKKNPPGCLDEKSPNLQVRQFMPALKALGFVAGRGRAKAGGDLEVQRNAAWARIEEAATTLLCGSELEQWLAAFFRELLAIRDAQGKLVEAKRLLPAFNTLYLSAPAGRRSMDDDQIVTLLAMEERERQESASHRDDRRYKHGDAEAARKIVGAKSGVDPSRLAEVRKQHSDIVRIVSPNAAKGPEGEWIRERSWLTEYELEALALKGKSAE